MPGFWEPPTQQDTSPRRRLLAEHKMDGLERPAPHILASPPGTSAPIGLINYTPKTGEVHAPGVPAPEHELNYSLMPHNMGAGADAPMGQFTPYLAGAPGAREPLSGMVQPSWVQGPGAGADAPPGVGIPPGGEALTGRYGTAANMRANTFSPGQPPLSPAPYGVGPGPRLQASGPAVRPFEQRGTSIGNASTFGQDQGSFGGGFGAGGERGMGAGQTRPKQDFTGTSDDTPDASQGRVTATRTANADAAGAVDPNAALQGGASRGGAPTQSSNVLPSGLPQIPGYTFKTIYAWNADTQSMAPSHVVMIPDGTVPGLKSTILGYFMPGGGPDPLTHLPPFQVLPPDVRKEMEGSGKDPSR